MDKKFSSDGKQPVQADDDKRKEQEDSSGFGNDFSFIRTELQIIDRKIHNKTVQLEALIKHTQRAHRVSVETHHTRNVNKLAKNPLDVEGKTESSSSGRDKDKMKAKL